MLEALGQLIFGIDFQEPVVEALRAFRRIEQDPVPPQPSKAKTDSRARSSSLYAADAVEL